MLPSVRPWEVEKSGSHTVVQEQACLLLGLQSKTLAELEDIFTETAEAQELASGIGDAAEARQWLRTKLQAVGEKAGFRGVLGKALGRVGPTFPIASSGSLSEQSRSVFWLCSTQSLKDLHSSTSPCSTILWDIVTVCRVRVWLPSCGGLWEEEKRMLI